MEGSWKPALDEILKVEGGKIDHPKDPGGRTNQGVTQNVYNQYRFTQGQPLKDVFDMGQEERDAVYKHYWNMVGGDKLPAGVDLEAFDTAVNQARNSREAPGKLAQDLVAQTAGLKTAEERIEGFHAARQQLYEGYGTFPTFGKGWTNRNTEVQGTAQDWRRASQQAYPPPNKQPSLPPPLPASAHQAVQVATTMGLQRHSNSRQHRS